MLGNLEMQEMSWEAVKKVIRRFEEWGIVGLIHCLGQQINQRIILYKRQSSHEEYRESGKDISIPKEFGVALL